MITKLFKIFSQDAKVPLFVKVMIFHDDAVDFFEEFRILIEQDFVFCSFTIQLHQVNLLAYFFLDHLLQGNNRNTGLFYSFNIVSLTGAADSLQLAAALVAAEHQPQALEFVSLDERLNEAASREGFPVVRG